MYYQVHRLTYSESVGELGKAVPGILFEKPAHIAGTHSHMGGGPFKIYGFIGVIIFKKIRKLTNKWAGVSMIFELGMQHLICFRKVGKIESTSKIFAAGVEVEL